MSFFVRRKKGAFKRQARKKLLRPKRAGRPVRIHGQPESAGTRTGKRAVFLRKPDCMPQSLHAAFAGSTHRRADSLCFQRALRWQAQSLCSRWAPFNSPVLLCALGMWKKTKTATYSLKATTPRLPLTRGCCMRAFLRGMPSGRRHHDQSGTGLSSGNCLPG